MAGEDERVGDDDVFAAGGREDDDLGDVVGSEGLAAAGQCQLQSTLATGKTHA